MVVAAAILSVKGDQVLAARRTRPAETAGRWELPGGKVEPGERPEAALIREIGEELGCLIDVLDWLPGEALIDERRVLRASTARITAGEARPRDQDGGGGSAHDRVRWLRADELDEVDWLAPDRPFLAPIRHLLAPDAPDPEVRVHAIFFEEYAARAVADRLRGDGWAAEVGRERYQGEDDDEDHPWSVTTDAPAFLVEMFVDEYDGWLDVPDEQPDESRAPEPLDLPAAPRRVKRGAAGHGIDHHTLESDL